MKIQLLKDKRNLKAGDVVETPSSIGSKFIRQGFAVEVVPKKKTAKKKIIRKKLSDS